MRVRASLLVAPLPLAVLLGSLIVVVHAVPTGVAWNGRAHGRRLVRARFALTHAATLSVLAASGVWAWEVLVLRGLAVALFVLTAGSFLPGRDRAGRAGAG